MALPIALQLYTVRDPMKADLEGTLKQVADIGYKYVEVAGTYERSAADFAALLKKHGLTPVSMHSSLVNLTEHFDQTIADAKALNVKYVVCSFLSPAQREDYAGAASKLADAADKADKQGIVVAYHNHSFEFDKTPSGQRGLDILFDSTKDRKLQAELDIYWVQHGKDSPTAWMQKLAGRLPLLHVKDMDHSENRGFAEVGTGTVDIAAAVKLAPQVGVKYLIVEQDSAWKGSPVESAKLSFENLTKILSA